MLEKENFLLKEKIEKLMNSNSEKLFRIYENILLNKEKLSEKNEILKLNEVNKKLLFN